MTIKTAIYFPVGYPSKSFGVRRGKHNKITTAFNADSAKLNTSVNMDLFQIRNITIRNEKFVEDKITSGIVLDAFEIVNVAPPVIEHDQFLDDKISTAIAFDFFEIKNITIRQEQFLDDKVNASVDLDLFEIVNVSV